jgi:hypothetical protein
MADDKPVSVSDESKVAIPIKNLIGILSTVAVSTWAYFGVIERLNFIEMKLESHWEEIEENDDWIDEWKPPADVQRNIERVRELEIKIVELETRLGFMEQNK